MKRTLKFYEIKYASGLFDKRGMQERIIYSDKELLPGEFVVVEHVNFGLFIGLVTDEPVDQLPNWDDERVINSTEYRYVQHIDLSDYIKSIERTKRKEELRLEMEKRFAEIDKEKKYEYYASIDASFKSLLDEYKDL